MELRDYLRTARSRWWLIVVMVAIGTIGAGAITLATTPMYQSTARLFISTPPSTASDAYTGALFSQQRVQSYADVVSSGGLAQKVVDQLGLTISAGTLQKRISATAVTNTVILDVSVTDPSAAMAQRIDRTLVEDFQAAVAQLETPPNASVPLVKATVIASSSLPTTPVSPRKLRNLALGVLLGLILGFGAAVLREILDTTVTSIDSIGALKGVPLLGRFALDRQTPSIPLITDLTPHNPRVEAFRMLRTNLRFLSADTSSQVLVVTSALPAEGKTSTAINTALALAQAGQRVLLVDADLRRPSIATTLNLEPNVGLTSVLLGDITLEAGVQHHGASGVDVLASGPIPPNPSEILQTQAMAHLIGETRRAWDVVIIDSAPLLPVADTPPLVAAADGAVLVIRYGKTTKDEVAGAAEKLEAVGAPLRGAVLNQTPRKNTTSSYAYNYDSGSSKAPSKLSRRQRRKLRKRSIAQPD